MICRPFWNLDSGAISALFKLNLELRTTNEDDHNARIGQMQLLMLNLI